MHHIVRKLFVCTFCFCFFAVFLGTNPVPDTEYIYMRLLQHQKQNNKQMEQQPQIDKCESNLKECKETHFMKLSVDKNSIMPTTIRLLFRTYKLW